MKSQFLHFLPPISFPSPPPLALGYCSLLASIKRRLPKCKVGQGPTPAPTPTPHVREPGNIDVLSFLLSPALQSARGVRYRFCRHVTKRDCAANVAERFVIESDYFGSEDKAAFRGGQQRIV